jgi:nucleotide-binding universal stress UspA family protein
MKTLLAVDGSAYTKRMLGYVTAHEEIFGSRHEYTVLTVVPLMNARAAAFTSAEVLMQYYDEESDKVLAPVKSFLAQQGWNVEFLDRRGSPGEQIAEVATGGEFDLVVMGSHGHSALAGVVMGSVATQVLAKCKTPVLLIR